MISSLPPMISAKSLGAMPEFISSEIGNTALGKVINLVGMPHAVIENRNHFIPQTMLASFLEQSARISGETEIGLLIAPNLTIRDYDIWGEYVLAAPSLEASLKRSAKAIKFHSADTVHLAFGNALKPDSVAILVAHIRKTDN